MTPTEFKAKRAQLGMTQAKVAELLGVHRITVAKWERGDRPILEITRLALEYLILTHGNGRRKRYIDVEPPF